MSCFVTKFIDCTCLMEIFAFRTDTSQNVDALLGKVVILGID